MASAEGVTGTSAWPIENTITNRPCSSQCSAVRPITLRAGETDGRLHQSEPRCESKQSCPPPECHRHSVMATGLAAQVSCCNMVWEMKSQRGQEGQSQGQAADTAFDLLRCHERSSAHGPLEYDDLPELQEVSFDQSSLHTFPVTPDLSGQDQSQRSWLTELADIATGPQSPLLQTAPQRRSSPVQIFSSSSLHSYARPPLTSSSAPGPGPSRRPRRTRASSESDSGMFWSSSFSDDDDLGWSHSWPSTVWHCFLKGTRVRFHRGQNVEWQEVEDLLESDEESDEDDDGHRQSSSLKSYGAEGLKLVASEETVAFGQSVLKLTFDPGSTEAGLLTAECRPDHPFFMKDKGWASFYPSLTVVQYGIPCYEVQLGDVCLPPGHRDANNCDDSVVFDTFRSFDFTPLDSSAVYVLSSMARQRRASQSSGGTVSPDCDAQEASGHASSGKRGLAQSASSAMTAKCKRPMNAFMLFAKKYRVEYTQMYPGKDNRAISVILGDRWKKMRSEERRMFTAEAKALAEEQKRLNPDCWKRKRTNSGSQQN